MTSSLDARSAASASSSDFLLLTTDQTTPLLSLSPHSTHASIPLPPPRFRPVLQAAAIIDLLFVLGYGATIPLTKLPASAVSLNLITSLVVLVAVSSVRVREKAPLLLGQLIVSALVLLYRLNELVQMSSNPSGPIPRGRLFGPVSIWYLGSFAFSLLHYLLFIVFVGVRNRRNPFVGHRRAATREGGTRTRSRSRNGRRRRSTWGEERWDGRQEVVRAGGSVRSNSFRNDDDEVEEVEDERFEEEAQGEEEEGFDSDNLSANSTTDSEEDDEDDDEDDLIDIPKPGHSTLRSRTSRASLLSLPTEPISRGNALRASRNYGSMRSLSGI
ncbi:uncharacterized protein JCM6883_004806 [Sporobolomyces salmoneus]|uniref:uncharacterized protein n=1 Tax=Sporobolomyces salmoneus TaxID=183962 RepID=UPI003180C4E1